MHPRRKMICPVGREALTSLTSMSLVTNPAIPRLIATIPRTLPRDMNGVLAWPALPAFEPLIEALDGQERILDLGCGTGRLANLLVDRGHEVVAVDSSARMLAYVDRRARTIHADIQELELGEKFDVVVLASNLVNTGIDTVRESFLNSCARHVSRNGRVFIEHHPPEWIATVREHERQVGEVTIRLKVLNRQGTAFTAIQDYFWRDRHWRERFTATVVDHAMLSELLQRHGLIELERLTPRWIITRPG